MNDPELIALVTQAGSAGLIGWLWVTERRAGADREKRLAETHDRLMQERTSVDQLVRCIDANTRALTALEVLCRSDLASPAGLVRGKSFRGRSPSRPSSAPAPAPPATSPEGRDRTPGRAPADRAPLADSRSGGIDA